MNQTITKLSSIKSKALGYWSERIISQLEYALELSLINSNQYNELIKNTVEFLDKKLVEDGSITKCSALEAEKMLGSLSEAAKKFKIICAAHAHIDMNWMWGYAETVAVTLDTFRTMLNLMNEYPEFTFSQSQASVYKIVEENDPCMLEEIKKRVKEGRWEVTASTWVETDKNMPNGESLARHILYTKKYLSELLDICPDSLKIDFEPDTFGHNLNVPEILSNGGVKFYYHCRGYDKRHIYRWQSPSGKTILVYREPFWYNAQIDSSMALHVPEFCTKHGLDTMLKVYGVGDHGGGPTRRDIEKIIDMASWPVFPDIKFGTFAQYFNAVEKISDTLPVETNELNFIFTGCYTSQSRIKMSNRIGEAKLNEAEAYSAISSAFADGKYCSKTFENAWEKVLFNHFHDILPGSGVIDTREYAMGQFQEVLAAANTETSKAFRNITSKIDTSGLFAFEEDIRDTISEGAGVGFAIKDFGVPQTERGRGKGRILHFFNPSGSERTEPVEVIIWDWPGDSDRMLIRDASGNPVRHQLLKNDKQHFTGESYWGHKYMRVLIDVTVPAYGYTTYTLIEKDMNTILTQLSSSYRVEREDAYVLENDYIKVCFDTNNAYIISMVDKRSGEEMVPDNKPTGIFRLIEEDDRRGMTSWIVGRYMQIFNLNESKNVKISGSCLDASALKQWIKYSIEFGKSKINVTVSLDYNSTRLNYTIECDWQERAVKGKYVPQLNFYMPLNYKCKAYKYDIPFGTIERDAKDMDVPGNSWMAGIPEEGTKTVMLVTDTKYGFRGFNDSLAVSLIRSSYDPDPYPEFGIHEFSFALDIVENATNGELIKRAFDYNHPIRFISGTVHEGTMPLEKSFISLESGSVAISAVKVPETDSLKQEGSCCSASECTASCKKIIMRVYETEGVKTKAVVKFAEKISKAWFVDINEKLLTDKNTSDECESTCGCSSDNCNTDNCNDENCNCIEIDGDTLTFDVDAYSIANICVELG
ncbi:MAG TPA: alpha-mannosidase [Clostridiaceae bacterium]|nr:alpha-mannosidase [Clostridiaceae bacterium]